MNIGIDLDGCLVDWDTAMARLMERLSETPLVIPAIHTKWAWTEDYDQRLVRRAWDHIKASNTFWRDLAPLPGCMDALNAVRRAKWEGHNIYFITSRVGNFVKHQTETWLRERGLTTPTVLIAHDKGRVARGLELHRFVDDKPENCEEVIRHCGTACAVRLLDLPSNQSYEGHPYIARVSSVAEVLSGL